MGNCLWNQTPWDLFLRAVVPQSMGSRALGHLRALSYLEGPWQSLWPPGSTCPLNTKSRAPKLECLWKMSPCALRSTSNDLLWVFSHECFPINLYQPGPSLWARCSLPAFTGLFVLGKSENNCPVIWNLGETQLFKVSCSSSEVHGDPWGRSSVESRWETWCSQQAMTSEFSLFKFLVWHSALLVLPSALRWYSRSRTTAHPLSAPTLQYVPGTKIISIASHTLRLAFN